MNQRLDRLAARRTDPAVASAKLLNEFYRHLHQSESVRYVIGAMQPIDPEYTKNTFVQGDRVANQLSKRLKEACEYEYQGSVTNDTHIKAKSDIDLLVIISKFFSLEQPQQPKIPYKGDPLQDLMELRKDAEACLSAAFPEASVDSSGSTALCIEGGSLTRSIDVVPANWYDSNEYEKTKDKVYRGVQVLDCRKKIRIKNTPFLHNFRIDEKDRRVTGGLRKAARLMKSLKYDSENIELSSYDIVGIAYNMDDRVLRVPPGHELSILGACLSWCELLEADAALREGLYVPDGHRKVFCDDHATLQGLQQLVRELRGLANDVLNENKRSFQKLAEARVEY